MARQQTYAPDAIVHDGDRWLITDITDNGTKSLSVSALAEYFASTGIADPNRVGFHYEYTTNNVLAPGQFRYVDGSVNNFGTISQIEIHRYTNRGVDFNPALSLIDQTNLKITDVTEATSTGYGYFRANSYSQDGDTITFNLNFLSASGQVPQGNTVFTVLGHFEGVTGGVIKEGLVDPITGEVVGQTGDVYFHVRPDVQELDVYGPLSGNVPLNNDYSGWGDPIALKGVDGEGVTGVRYEEVTTPEEGTNIIFTVGEGDLATELNPVFVQRGEKGDSGDGYIDFTVAANGDLSVTGTGDNADVTANILGPQGPINAVASYQQLTDYTPTEGPFAGIIDDYLEVNFDNGTILIPDAEDGSAGRSIADVRMEETDPVEDPRRFNIFVDFDGEAASTTPIGSVSNGTDGTPGRSITGTTVGAAGADGSDALNHTLTINYSTGSPDVIVNAFEDGTDGSDIRVNGEIHRPNLTIEGTAVQSTTDNGTDTVTVVIDQAADELPATATDGEVLTYDGSDWVAEALPADTITVQDETVVVGGSDSTTTLNFTGGVVVTPGVAGTVNIDITGGGTPVAMTPAINHSGDQEREVGETFSILLTAVHVDTFVITPPVNADLTNGWTQTNSTDSNGNVTVIITPDDLTSVDTSVLTVNGTYTLAGNPDVFNFPEITIPLETFFGWHYAQVANDVALPTSPAITVNEFFSAGGTGTLNQALPDNDQGHFNSPEDQEGVLTDGAWLYFAFPGMTEYKFYNEGRRLRNVETQVNTATNTFRYYRINVGDDFEIQITT